MEVRSIEISKIPFSQKLCYHLILEIPVLQKSISRGGILQPLWIADARPPQIIDGHRRLQIARRMGITKIPVIFFPTEQLQKSFLKALHLNLTGEGLSLMEKMMCIQIAESLFGLKAREEIMEVFGFSKIPKIREIARQAVSKPHWLKMYFHDFNIQLRSMKTLLNYPVDNYESWLKMGTRLRMKGAELSNLLEQVHEISLQNAITPDDFLESLRLEQPFSGNSNIPQKVSGLKQLVAEKRYPLLSRIQKKIGEEARGLAKEFTHEIYLDWDKSLENPGVTVTFRVENLKQLREQIKALSRNDIQNRIEKLLERMNELPEEAE